MAGAWWWLHGMRRARLRIFIGCLCREGVTVLNQTPSAFRHLIAAQDESLERHRLRCVIFGGEALEVATLKPWYGREANRDTSLVNMYGITETTVHVTYRPLESADTERSGASPVGCRIPDLRTYMLDGSWRASSDRRERASFTSAGRVWRGVI